MPRSHPTHPRPHPSDETISTLRFGERAKKMVNKAVVNEERSVPELTRMLRLAQVTDPQKQSVASRS